MLEIKDKSRFKKRVSNQVPSNLPKASMDRVCNPKSQKGRCGNSPSDKLTCAMCRKKDRGECLVGTGNSFGCGNEGHKVRDFPNVRSEKNESGQA